MGGGLARPGPKLAGMEFQRVVAQRRMIRTFTREPVLTRSLDRILGNAVRGPSAGFSQGQELLVLDGEALPRFWDVAGEPEAVGPFRAAFGIPADYEPIGAVAIGHEAGRERRDLSSRRRPLDQMVHHQHW